MLPLVTDACAVGMATVSPAFGTARGTARESQVEIVFLRGLREWGGRKGEGRMRDGE